MVRAAPQWRSSAIALGATAAVLAVSFVLTPLNWFAWVDLLIANTRQGGAASIPILLVVRLPIGIAPSPGARRVISAGSSGRCMLALPRPS